MTPSLIIQKCLISLLQDIIIHLAFSLGPVVIIAWRILYSGAACVSRLSIPQSFRLIWLDLGLYTYRFFDSSGFATTVMATRSGHPRIYTSREPVSPPTIISLVGPPDTSPTPSVFHLHSAFALTQCVNILALHAFEYLASAFSSPSIYHLACFPSSAGKRCTIDALTKFPLAPNSRLPSRPQSHSYPNHEPPTRSGTYISHRRLTTYLYIYRHHHLDAPHGRRLPSGVYWILKSYRL
jgi:hypothetical protein